MPAFDPAERSMSASIASNTRWAYEPDRTRATAPARDAFMARFETEVDPERRLTPEERAKRAQNAKRIHYQRMALKSAQARRRSGDDSNAQDDDAPAA